MKKMEKDMMKKDKKQDEKMYEKKKVKKQDKQKLIKFNKIVITLTVIRVFASI